ncbi:MAG TPA: type VI secretion system-associated protein TagF [Sphingomonas sp.]|jgi:type VI secretion system protein ImpM
MGSTILWGKLPAHGDFVARGLSASGRDRLDDWLAASLADARGVFGDGFDDAYDQAPPWRFAWPDPPHWTAGAMAPSVDAVGRRYPILLARTAVSPAEVEPVAEAVEELLYTALVARWGADTLTAAASAIAVTQATPWTSGPRWWTLGAEGFGEQAVAGEHPPALMRNMLMQEDGS